MNVRIAPSILAGDFARLAEEAEAMRLAGADELHVDVMDGHFVPNLTIGPCVVESLRRSTQLPLDVHLMISQPEKYAEAFLDAGADILTFHIEATDLQKAAVLLESIRERGRKAGLALSPPTSIEAVVPLLGSVDRLLVMTVHPGFGGQSFMSEVLSKVERAREVRPQLEIEVDGGLNPDTAHQAGACGANVIVAGTSVFGAADPAQAIAAIRSGTRAGLDSRQQRTQP